MTVCNQNCSEIGRNTYCTCSMQKSLQKDMKIAKCSGTAEYTKYRDMQATCSFEEIPDLSSVCKKKKRPNPLPHPFTPSNIKSTS